MAWPRNFNKFGSIRQDYQGHSYHSKREAAYAAELDLRVRAGELKEWRRQEAVELRVNDKKICVYTIDFVEVDKKGKEMWTEVKGFETPEWRLKWKLFDALFPERNKQIIK